MEVDKELEELLKAPEMLKLYKGKIDGTMGTLSAGRGMLLQIRGWGFLTGQGACKLPEAEAEKLQDDFTEWLTKLLNYVKDQNDKPASDVERVDAALKELSDVFDTTKDKDLYAWLKKNYRPMQHDRFNLEATK